MSNKDENKNFTAGSIIVVKISEYHGNKDKRYFPYSISDMFIDLFMLSLCVVLATIVIQSSRTPTLTNATKDSFIIRERYRGWLQDL